MGKRLTAGLSTSKPSRQADPGPTSHNEAHHLQGVHQNRIRIKGEGPHALEWELGIRRDGTPHMVVRGRWVVRDLTRPGLRAESLTATLEPILIGPHRGDSASLGTPTPTLVAPMQPAGPQVTWVSSKCDEPMVVAAAEAAAAAFAERTPES
jgi:hypothetical protein